MPKINFNVPMFDEYGEPLMKQKTDPKKAKFDVNGTVIHHIIKDEKDQPVYEQILVKDILVRILNATYNGDENVPFGDKVKRGKLAKKIMTSSTANYRTEELKMIEEFAGRSATTAFSTQLDEIINGKDEPEEAPNAVVAATPDVAAAPANENEQAA